MGTGFLRSVFRVLCHLPDRDLDMTAIRFIDAARRNDVDGCRRLFLKSSKANLHVNSKALLAAAQSQSYEAFEEILLLDAADNDGFMSSGGFADGPAMAKVERLASRDARLQRALDHYNAEIEANSEEALSAAFASREEFQEAYTVILPDTKSDLRRMGFNI